MPHHTNKQHTKLDTHAARRYQQWRTTNTSFAVDYPSLETVKFELQRPPRFLGHS